MVSVTPRHLTIERRVRYAVLEPPLPPATEIWFVLHGYNQLAHRFLRHFLPIREGGRLIVAAEGLHRQYLEAGSGKVGASWMTSEDRLTDIEDYVAYLDRLNNHVIRTQEKTRGVLHQQRRREEDGERRRETDAESQPAAGGERGREAAGESQRAASGESQPATGRERGRETGGDGRLDTDSPPQPERVVALGFSQGVHTLCRWLAFGRSRIDRAILWGAMVPPDLDLTVHADALSAADLQLVMGDRDEYFGAQAVAAQERRLRSAHVPFTSHSFSGGHRLDSATLKRLSATPGRPARPKADPTGRSG